MDQCRMECLALIDEAVLPHDLGLCFSYTLPGHGFENCETYEEIHEILKELGIDPYDI